MTVDHNGKLERYADEAAGASEGQEPVAHVNYRADVDGDVHAIAVWNGPPPPRYTKLYVDPSAEIAALRERLNAAASLNAVYAQYITDLRNGIAGMEKDADAGKDRRFEIRQGGMTVAATEGPGVDAYRDAVHYFWQYQQDATEDEPVEMVELTTVMRIDTAEKQG